MHMRHRLPCCLTILPRQVDFGTVLSMRSIPMAHQQLDKSPKGLIYVDVCMQRGIAAHAQILIAPSALDKNGIQSCHLLSHVIFEELVTWIASVRAVASRRCSSVAPTLCASCLPQKGKAASYHNLFLP